MAKDKKGGDMVGLQNEPSPVEANKGYTASIHVDDNTGDITQSDND